MLLTIIFIVIFLLAVLVTIVSPEDTQNLLSGVQVTISVKDVLELEILDQLRKVKILEIITDDSGEELMLLNLEDYLSILMSKCKDLQTGIKNAQP